jgi:hypothetical protein
LGNKCINNDNVLKRFSNPSNAQNDLKIAIELIEKTIGFKTTPTKTLKDFEIPDKLTNNPLLHLTSNQEILTINDVTFRKINGLNNEQSYAGAYHPNSGRIFLVEGSWCYSNLIHETLHSRSVFSNLMPCDNLKFVFEGLTEFLVGVVLKIKISECFDLWRNVENCFLSPYLNYVKPWYYLSMKIDLTDIILLYFNTNEPYPYLKLGEILGKQTGHTFDIFDDLKKSSIFQIFKERLGNVYRKDFAAFQGSVIDEINLGGIEQFKLFSA